MLSSNEKEEKRNALIGMVAGRKIDLPDWRKIKKMILQYDRVNGEPFIYYSSSKNKYGFFILKELVEQLDKL